MCLRRRWEGVEKGWKRGGKGVGVMVEICGGWALCRVAMRVDVLCVSRVVLNTLRQS